MAAMIEKIILRIAIYFTLLLVLLLVGQGEIRRGGIYADGAALQADALQIAAEQYSTPADEAYVTHQAERGRIRVYTGRLDNQRKTAFQICLKKSLFSNKYIVKDMRYGDAENWKHPVRINTMLGSYLVKYSAEDRETGIIAAAHTRQIAGIAALALAILLLTCCDVLLQAGKGARYRTLMRLGGFVLVIMYFGAAIVWPDPFPNW